MSIKETVVEALRSKPMEAATFALTLPEAYGPRLATPAPADPLSEVEEDDSIVVVISSFFGLHDRQAFSNLFGNRRVTSISSKNQPSRGDTSISQQMAVVF